MWDAPYHNELPDRIGYWWLNGDIVNVTAIRPNKHGDGRTVEYYFIGSEEFYFAEDKDTDWERFIPRSRPAQSDAPPTPQ